MFTCNCD